MQNENINIFWSYLIVEELIRSGIDYFCISPGSRSTPLTSAAARHPRAQKKIFYDERGAAYHALGYARATGKPAVLICTSGTAAANYFPAVIEAHNDRIPMIILSADRPPELLQTQANQTIIQQNLYGDYVNWHFNLPVPSAEIPSQMPLTTVDLMISKTLAAPKGPVHLNCMFREPLEPSRGKIDEKYLHSIESWHNSEEPYTRYRNAAQEIGDEILEEVGKIIKNSRRGLLILGRLPLGTDVKVLIEKLRWPVFAGITSGARSLNNPYMIQNYDHLLLDKDFKPDTILHFGAQFASKRLLKLFASDELSDYILVEESAERIDAEHRVSLRVQSNASRFAEKLSAYLSDNTGNSTWFKDIKQKEKIVTQVIGEQFKGEGNLTEAQIAWIISREIKPQSALFLSNSMPVRDMNSFAEANEALSRVGANRGASGIDGIIASAGGFAEGTKRTTVLLIGDLAFLHDMNSLHQLKNNKFPLIIILLNNRGGGIFRFLPISQFDGLFEDYFLTPHDYNFKNAALQFGIPYTVVESREDLIKAFNDAQENNKTTLIEVKTDSQKNHTVHTDLIKKISDLLNKK